MFLHLTTPSFDFQAICSQQVESWGSNAHSHRITSGCVFRLNYLPLLAGWNSTRRSHHVEPHVTLVHEFLYLMAPRLDLQALFSQRVSPWGQWCEFKSYSIYLSLSFELRIIFGRVKLGSGGPISFHLGAHFLTPRCTPFGPSNPTLTTGCGLRVRNTHVNRVVLV